MTQHLNRTGSASGHPDAPKGGARWDQLDGAGFDRDSAHPAARPRRGFWERLGMLFNLHPRGPQGG